MFLSYNFIATLQRKCQQRVVEATHRAIIEHVLATCAQHVKAEWLFIQVLPNTIAKALLQSFYSTMEATT